VIIITGKENEQIKPTTALIENNKNQSHSAK
jgi:hypothetical protein